MEEVNEKCTRAVTADNYLYSLNFCRICSSFNDKICGIFSPEGISKNLAFKINKYLPLKVTENDLLPLKCCLDCVEVINNWHEFVLKATETNRKFQQVFNKEDSMHNLIGKSIIPFISKIRKDELNSSNFVILCKQSKFNFKINTNCLKNEDKLNELTVDDSKQLPNELQNSKCTLGNIPKSFSDSNNGPIVPDFLLIELKEEDSKTTLERNNIVLHSLKSEENQQLADDEIQSQDLLVNSQKLSQEVAEDSIKSENSCIVNENNLYNTVEDKKTIKSKNNKNSKIVKIRQKKYKKVAFEKSIDMEKIDYDCEFCLKSFTKENEIISHINDEHLDSTVENKTVMTNEKLQKQKKLDNESLQNSKVIVEGRIYYNCQICGKNLHSPYTYIWHMRIHSGERPYVCDLCGKQFRVSQGLIRHLRETHEGVKNFACDICGRKFSTKRNVEEHRRIHTNERPYVCAHCGKAFKQKASLYVHNRSHSDVYPFKCSYCGLMFRSRPPMLLHITKHTGEKPYPCEVCGRRFRIKYELKRHTLIHSDEKPFSCTVCGTRFRQKRYLRNHNKINHKRRIEN